MQAEALMVDHTDRGVIHRYFYPISYVQDFRPCSWDQFETYVCEGETFRALMMDRHRWAVDEHIKCLIYYNTIQDDPETPPVYRLFVEFTCNAHAEAYIARWS